MGEKETDSGRFAGGGAALRDQDDDGDDDAPDDGSGLRKAAPPRDKPASSQRATNLNTSRSNRMAGPGDDSDPDDAAINNTKSNVKNLVAIAPGEEDEGGNDPAEGTINTTKSNTF